MLTNRLRVLITGATGFVGKHLCDYLLSQGIRIRAIGRKREPDFLHENYEYHQITDINGETNWGSLLSGIDVVIHLAARVHQEKDKGMKALALYQEINVKGTEQLASAAVKADVKRFIYISSIKVNGEKTIGMPYRAENQPHPKDAYSLSKLQGEQILQEVSRRSGMEWVIIRPPLVYGPGVKGNFGRLINLARTRFPLPFASVKNHRSLVSVYNLCSFIQCTLSHPNAAGEVFLVSDNNDLSTPGLVKALRRAQQRISWLYPFPKTILKLLAFITGKSAQLDRLIDSLQVNIEKSQRLLNWSPPYSVEESMKALYVTDDKMKPNYRPLSNLGIV